MTAFLPRFAGFALRNTYSFNLWISYIGIAGLPCNWPQLHAVSRLAEGCACWPRNWNTHIPLATSTTVLSGLDFCANCDFCVKSWVRGICMWRILWLWCFLMIRRRIRVLHVDQFGRSQDRSRPVLVPTQTNSNEKGIQGLQGFYFFCANCIKRDELIEPTGPNRSFHFV